MLHYLKYILYSLVWRWASHHVGIRIGFGYRTGVLKKLLQSISMATVRLKSRHHLGFPSVSIGYPMDAYLSSLGARGFFSAGRPMAI